MPRKKNNSAHIAQTTADKPYWKTTEDIADEEMARAAAKGWPDPDFDFRTRYQSGDRIHYILVNDLCGTKELLELTVRTVYARSLVAWEEHGCAHVIGYPSRDNIFDDRREAESYYKTTKVEARYADTGGGT